MNRTNFSKTDRQAHVEAWKSSTETQHKYCGKHGINPATFKGWVARYGGHRRTRRRAIQNALPATPLTFVQARLQLPEHRPIPAPSGVTLEHPGGSRLLFAELPPVEWLAELMRGL